MAKGQIIDKYPEPEYHAHEALSKTKLDKFAKSPRMYKAYVDGKIQFPQSPALLIGSVVHLALLEPDRFQNEVVMSDYGRRSKKFREEQDTLPDHYYLLTADEYAHIRQVLGAAYEFGLDELFAETENEQTIFWKHAPTDIKCRSRLDAIASDGSIRDLKTSSARTLDKFLRSARYDYRYHIQGWFYSEAFRSVYGCYPTSFKFHVVQTVQPFDVWEITMTPEMFLSAEMEGNQNMRDLRDCMDADAWPGELMPGEVALLDADKWFKKTYETHTARETATRLKGAFVC